MQSKTAGQIQNEIVTKDFGSYSHYDLGYAINDNLDQEIQDCISSHYDTFSGNSFCVCLIHGTDPLLTTVLRRKFYAWPYLPDPCPMQSVWLYEKLENKLTFLWALPDAWTMAVLSEECFPSKKYQRMALWCRWWYEGSFWTNIRHMYGIDTLSECEFNSRNRENGAQFVSDDVLGFAADASYLPEVRIKKLEAKGETRSMQLLHNHAREAN